MLLTLTLAHTRASCSSLSFTSLMSCRSLSSHTLLSCSLTLLLHVHTSLLFFPLVTSLTAFVHCLRSSCSRHVRSRCCFTLTTVVVQLITFVLMIFLAALDHSHQCCMSSPSSLYSFSSNCTVALRLTRNSAVDSSHVSVVTHSDSQCCSSS